VEGYGHFEESILEFGSGEGGGRVGGASRRCGVRADFAMTA
jgi:hypothetical protein